jgi:hypothetical protein
MVSETDRLVSQGHEDIILHDSVVQSPYDEVWVKEYVIEQRNNKKTWEEIAEGLKERGLDKITGQKCSSIHKEALARTLTTSTEAKEDFIEFTQDLKNMYGDSIKLMGEYIKALRNINEELGKIEIIDQDGKVNVLQTQMAIAKQIPLATGLMKEVREYVKNQISLYDTIEATKEQDVVWDEKRMISYINDALPTIMSEKIKAIREEYGDNIPLTKVEKIIVGGFK